MTSFALTLLQNGLLQEVHSRGAAAKSRFVVDKAGFCFCNQTLFALCIGLELSPLSAVHRVYLLCPAGRGTLPQDSARSCCRGTLAASTLSSCQAVAPPPSQVKAPPWLCLGLQLQPCGSLIKCAAHSPATSERLSDTTSHVISHGC